MNIKTCLEKLKLCGVLSFATVDHQGAPQIRCISAIHFEENSLSLLQEVNRSVMNFYLMEECRFLHIHVLKK